MNILGIGGYSHDSAAALLVDGRVVAAVAEERLSREKHAGGVPRLAVDYCLREAGITLEEVDHIGVYMQPGLRVGQRLRYRAGLLPRHPLYSAGFMGYELLHNLDFMRGMRSLCRGRARLHYMEHHPAHAASAFLCSPFDAAALLSVDYVGEWDCTWMGVGEGSTLRKLRALHYPNSLGVFYSAITDYLGFLRASDEYKVMGLASYGEPEYADEFLRMLRPRDGGYDMDLSWTQWPWAPGSRRGYFSPKFIARFGPPRKKDEPIEPRHQNIAASAQRALEETVLHMARWLHVETGHDDLCLAGGVALNCSMNGRLLRESPFKRIYIQPASGDDGIALGAALQLHHRFAGEKNIPRPAAGTPPQAPPFQGVQRLEMTHAYLGPGYTDEEIVKALVEEGDLRSAGVARSGDHATAMRSGDHATAWTYEHCDNIEARTAELLAEGKIVGWFQGRMEFGPRALGSRSILADPTRPDMQDKLNTQVKHREEFRPFAPVVTEEDASRYFDGCTRSPFMLFVHPVRKEAQSLLPAITHVDGTARVQTLRQQDNPRFYQLLREFEQRRGVPVLVNTSFNVMGEPIVNTPVDALRCFQGTGIEALVMGNYLVRK